MTIPFASMTLGIIEFLIESLIGIVTSFYNVILTTIMSLFADLFYGIGIELMWLADFAQGLFRRLAGLDPYWYNGEVTSGDPILTLVSDSSVQEVFLALSIVAVVMLIVSTVVQIIRVQYTQEGAKNTVGNIVGQTLKSFAMFAIIPIGSIFGIFGANVLLGLVDSATNISGSSTVSGAIFVASAGEANRVRLSAEESDFGVFDGLLDFGVKITVDPATGDINEIEATNPMGLGYLPDIDINSQADIDTYNSLLESSENVSGTRGPTFTSNAGTATEVINDIAERIDTAFALNAVNQNTEGSAYDADSLGATFDYTNLKMVKTYYDTSEINYLVLYVAAGITIWSLYMAVFGLIMRLYKLVILFVISPPAVAIMPLDGGNALKQWRDKFIGNVVGVYGVVVALNLFFIILPMLKQIKLFDPSNFANYYYNNFTYLIMVVVGCYMFKDLSKLVSDIFGKGEDILSSGSAMASKATSAAAGVAMAAATGGATLAASAGNAMKARSDSKMAKTTMADAESKMEAGDLEGARASYEQSKLYSGRASQRKNMASAQFKSTTGFIGKGVDKVTTAMGLGSGVAGRTAGNLKGAYDEFSGASDAKFEQQLANAGKPKKQSFEEKLSSEELKAAAAEEKAASIHNKDLTSYEKKSLTKDYNNGLAKTTKLADGYIAQFNGGDKSGAIKDANEAIANGGLSDTDSDYLRKMVSVLESINGKEQALADAKSSNNQKGIKKYSDELATEQNKLTTARSDYETKVAQKVDFVNNVDAKVSVAAKESVYKDIADISKYKPQIREAVTDALSKQKDNATADKRVEEATKNIGASLKKISDKVEANSTALKGVAKDAKKAAKKK